jgi:hypothetical protein
MPEYFYGLILIGSLERTPSAGLPVNGASQREIEAILAPRRERKSTTSPSGAGSLVPAGA